MAERFAQLNLDQWLSKVNDNFIPFKGWKLDLSDNEKMQLKEEAFLIFYSQGTVPEPIYQKAKEVVSYYLTDELTPKYQA